MMVPGRAGMLIGEGPDFSTVGRRAVRVPHKICMRVGVYLSYLCFNRIKLCGSESKHSSSPWLGGEAQERGTACRKKE